MYFSLRILEGDDDYTATVVTDGLSGEDKIEKSALKSVAEAISVTSDGHMR